MCHAHRREASGGFRPTSSGAADAVGTHLSVFANERGLPAKIYNFGSPRPVPALSWQSTDYLWSSPSGTMM